MNGFFTEELRQTVIDKAVVLAMEEHGALDTMRAAAVAGNLYDQLEQRRKSLRRSGQHLTNDIFKARLDCHIFFALVIKGWPKSKRLSDGSITIEPSPVSFDQRLGFPTRTRMYSACRRIKEKCGKAMIQNYRQAYRDWREAHSRFLATETDETWQWYVRGKHNRNSVAYRTRVDLNRRGGVEHFRSRRRFKYMLHELLPRLDESQRAATEMAAADKKMVALREEIFETMGVPTQYRPLI